MSDMLLGGLIGILVALVLAETVLIVQLCRFLKSHDVSLFSDDWYPVRIRKFPFTSNGAEKQPISLRSEG